MSKITLTSTSSEIRGQVPLYEKHSLYQGWRTNGTRHNILGTPPIKTIGWVSHIKVKNVTTPRTDSGDPGNVTPKRKVAEG
ncbi:hypothetical protein TNCV_4468921 [Trichonephila clavipes]|nr:hypothetical protein TNCV_4468921 [Trichonephila clavipes]